jgi:hypothetical protein
MAIAGLPEIEEQPSVPRRSGEGKGPAAGGRRLDIVDDAFAESVDAVGNERPLTRLRETRAPGPPAMRSTSLVEILDQMVNSRPS